MWDALFKENAYFNKSYFALNAKFRLARFEGVVDFSETRFMGVANFSSTRSGKSFSLHGARFRAVPDFNEAAFHAPPVLDAMHVSEQLTVQRGRWPFRFRHVPEPEKNAKDISRHFRALGKMAHEARDWLNEMEFFAQEIRARRFGEDFPLGEYRILRGLGSWMARKCGLRFMKPLMLKLRRKAKSSPWRGPNPGRFWFGMIYEKASNFGRSFARPLIGWGTAVLAFAVYYWFCAFGGGFGDALTLSIREGLVVSGMLRSGHLQTLLERLYGLPEADGTTVVELSNWIAGAMMLQTLVSAFFLFLFFLAVRNHFRIR